MYTIKYEKINGESVEKITSSNNIEMVYNSVKNVLIEGNKKIKTNNNPNETLFTKLSLLDDSNCLIKNDDLLF